MNYGTTLLRKARKLITNKNKGGNMPYGLDLLQGLGGQAAGGIVNEGLGLLFAGPKRKAQLKTAQGLQDLQIKGEKEMTDYNTSKQLELWKNTSYGAQREQMEKAGINPALMYGMGGGGGATAQIAQGNVSGQQAREPEASKGTEGMGIQMALLDAQRRNIDADTALKQADAEKTKGVDTGLAEAQIKSLSQGVENQKAQQALTEVETGLKAIETEIKGKTIKEQQDLIVNAAQKGVEEIDILHNQLLLDRAQREEKVKLLQAETIAMTLKGALMSAEAKKVLSDIQVNEAQINKWTNEIMQKWQEVKQGGQKISLDILKTQFDMQHPGLWNVIGGSIEDAVGDIMESPADKIKRLQQRK